MYAAIRQGKAKTGMAEELTRRIKEGAIPIISDVEGFMGYYVVYASDDTVTAISLFNNFASAEEANRRAIAWIEKDLGEKTSLAGIVLVTAQIPDGETVHEIWVSDEPIGNDRTKAKRVHTFKGQTKNAESLKFEFPKDTSARYVQVLTTESPSWVDWVEVEILVKVKTK